jgi:hypothetical protein
MRRFTSRFLLMRRPDSVHLEEDAIEPRSGSSGCHRGVRGLWRLGRARAAWAAPTFMRKEPKLYETYVGALTAATVPQLERAVSEAEQCITAAHASEGKLASACRKARDESLALKRQASPTVTSHSLDGVIRVEPAR